MTSKQYGLILPNKTISSAVISKRKLVPQLDSDEELQRSDEETSLNWVDSMMKKSVGNASMRATQRRQIKEAREQDPTVFQYDEVYDDMKAQNDIKKNKIKGDIDKKPKYINNILKQAAKRKLENELRMERKVQRERDEEGDKFADKESFVSASFLKKMDEMKTAEEEEQREMALEELRDVTKHKNFSVFYSHILEQTLGNEEITIKEEPSAQISEPKKKNYRKRKCSSDSSLENSSDEGNEQLHTSRKGTSVSSYSSESEISNKHTDSSDKVSSINISGVTAAINKVNPKPKPLTEEERILEISKVIAKRTTGEVFEKAVERFFQRKALL